MKEYGELIECSFSLIETEDSPSSHNLEAIREYVGHLNAARRDARETLFSTGFQGTYARYLVLRYYWYPLINLDLSLPDPFLPSIALDNRLVAMPMGAFDILRAEDCTALKAEEEDEYFGITQVDYLSDSALRDCLKKAISVTLARLKTSVCNYLRYHSSELEPAVVAAAFEVTTTCAELLCNEVATERQAQEFGANIWNRQLKHLEWQRVEVCLTNRGTRNLGPCNLVVKGPLNLARPATQVWLDAGASMVVPVTLQATEKGSFPFGVFLSWKEGERETTQEVGSEWIRVD